MLSRLSLMRVLAIFAVLAVSIPLAACGSDDTDDYKKDVKAAIDKLKTDTDEVNQKVQAQQTPEGKVAAFSELKGKIATAADSLDKLDPPDDAKSEHDQLVSQLRGLDDNLTALETAAKAKDQAAAQQALTGLTTELNAAQTTANQLEEKVK